MISVLVADDSFLMRRLISDILTSDGEIKVVGTASNGEQAIEMAHKLQPDVITMDLEMPGTDGLAATQKIMQEQGPKAIVIMLSAFTKEKADVTLDCLQAGAFDCILKPSGPLSMDLQRSELIARVKAAALARKEALTRFKNTVAVPEKSTQAVIAKDAFPLVIIGASTGGPPILEQIFSLFPSPLQAAVLIVQHMPEKFTFSMAQRMDQLSTMKVKEAEEGELIKPGIALVAPGNFHMQIRRMQDGDSQYRVHLNQQEPRKGLRPSIDVLLESVYDQFEGPVIGIILSGMGDDGHTGMRLIRKMGGRTIVQDPVTCTVDSMVASVMHDGMADEILAPEKIAFRLHELTS